MQPENLINKSYKILSTQIRVRYVGEIPNSQIIRAYKIKYSSNQADNKSNNHISCRLNMTIWIALT